MKVSISCFHFHAFLVTWHRRTLMQIIFCGYFLNAYSFVPCPVFTQRQSTFPCFVKRSPTAQMLQIGQFESSEIDSGREYDQTPSFAQVIRECNLDSRLVKIQKSDLPLVAEIHANGSWRLCLVTGFKVPNSMKEKMVDRCNEYITPPLLEIFIVEPGVDCNPFNNGDEGKTIIDIGQITSIWYDMIEDDHDNYAKSLLDLYMDAKTSLQYDFSVSHKENVMQRLYEYKIRPTNKKFQKSLSKKDINRVSNSFAAEDDRNHVQQLLRKAVKGGFENSSSNRLVDSEVVALELYTKQKFKNSNLYSKTKQLLAGASLLALDAELGGRFKRSPSIFVSAKYASVEGEIHVSEITFLSGGWIPVDESVRARTEARKFVKRNTKEDPMTNQSHKSKIFTAADERIMHRLECLAMGELLGTGFDAQDHLELDVKETLAALDLELTPEGAQKALVKVGKWSEKQRDEIQTGQKGIYQNYTPWSSELLACAKIFKEKVKYHSEVLLDECSMKTTENSLIEGRINLTSLPCISIDAKRTSFRDDAIGLRRRSMTGRKVKKGCKWELLIHIADVSDIYSPYPTPNLGIDLSSLRQVAETRGMSRYDLPLGPIHLMPPTALEALSLTVHRGLQPKSSENAVNRCVTLWVYIDEKDGRIMDAGLERSLISKPRPLTFDDASKLLSSNDQSSPESTDKQIKLLLGVIDKILSAWKRKHLERNEGARQREKRFVVREMVAKDTLDEKYMRDDGAKGSFQRTLGHKIVDNALDLHGFVLAMLLKKCNVPIPRASGSGADRGGRLGTAPLRRYIDGVAQRQALSALCDYGGPPMTREECSKVNKLATEAINRVNNLKSSKKASEYVLANNDIRKRKKSLRALASHFASTQVDDEGRIVPALSTGYENEVVLSGTGIVVRCRGVKGTLKTGENVLVKITKLDETQGVVEVEFLRCRD